ncbi:hypothetical protein RDI58_030058 [Solanum bulbocastanum]|uniref:Uncharacterized protein n=1 Tax=Solanum bulbocastanum TaxID=147425 RepID=A0AAN8SYV5_SOLBU
MGATSGSGMCGCASLPGG